MDESFAAYTVRGEGSLIELEDVVTHFIVMCNDNSSVSKSTFVTYRKGMTSVVGVGVGGGAGARKWRGPYCTISWNGD